MGVRLSQQAIAKAKPSDKPFELLDTEVPGLIVRIQPSGIKSFIVTWQRGKRKTIGRVGVYTIEQARFKARKMLLEADSAHERGEAYKPAALSDKAATLGEFFEQHYSAHAKAQQKDASANLMAIETEFGFLFTRKLAEVSPELLEKYRQQKISQGVSQNTVNRHFDRLRSLLSKAVEWGHVPTHPLHGLKNAKTDKAGVVRWLDKAEESALRKALAARDQRLQAARIRYNQWRSERGYELYPTIPDGGFGDHLTPMVLVSMNTGMRRGELCKILWRDVDFAGAQLTIRGGYAKSGQTRYLPLNAEALDALTRWQQQSTPNADQKVFAVLRVDKAWAAVLKSAKITCFRWHDLRHHFASRLVMAGVDLNTVRELLGHADIGMTLRYAHLAAEHKADAVAKLAEAT